MVAHMRNVEWFDEISIDDVPHVGGKNASLGEMYRELDGKGVKVPNGFATTAEAFTEFLRVNDLETEIARIIDGWDRSDVDDLAARTKQIRSLILGGSLPDDFQADVLAAYRKLSEEAGVGHVDVAVRSSATAEDLPEASFAGQQETYLMVHGDADVLDSIRRCFASLFTARAVSYREDMNIGQTDVALSACIQRMVRSDLASSGVIFTLDTDSGFPDVVYVTSAWGLGENVVQGRVIPDGYFVHKPRLRDGFRPVVGKQVGAKELRMVYDPQNHRVTNVRTTDAERATLCLTDDEVLDLGRWAMVIEDHYSTKRGTPTPMDIEWAKDGITGELFIVQARPETVHSQKSATSTTVFRLTGTGERCLEGLAVGERIATGKVRRIEDPRDMNQLLDG